MKISELIKCSDFEISNNLFDRDISNLYSCDLLSWVISHSKKGDVLITVLSNMNVVGVASLIDANAVIFADGVKPTEEMCLKANEEEISLITSSLNSVDIMVFLKNNE